MAAPATLRELALLHVEVLAKGTGGNTRLKCNYCQHTYTGSQTRQLAHLAGTSVLNQLVAVAAPAQTTFRKAGAHQRAPGSAGAGAPNPYDGNYVFSYPHYNLPTLVTTFTY